MNIKANTIAPTHVPKFSVCLALTQDDLLEAMRLRYRVFAQELGASGVTVDHAKQIETDRFDALSDHLILRDELLPLGAQIVGVYRVMRPVIGGPNTEYYSESEFDLSGLRASGKQLLELGRSCIAPEYRGGPALMHLWKALGEYVAGHDIQILFGTASFQGTDLDLLRPSLSLLFCDHLAPEDLRPTAIGANSIHFKDDASDIDDRKLATRGLPALIRSYLRMGGCVGNGAFVDHAFNTVDVCMIVDVANISPRQRALYAFQPE